jgi:hypothetical protein
VGLCQAQGFGPRLTYLQEPRIGIAPSCEQVPVSSLRLVALPSQDQRTSKVDVSIVRPEALAKELPVEYLSGMFQKEKQDLEWLILYFDFPALPQKLSGLCGGGKDPEAIDRRALDWIGHGLVWRE